MGVAKALVKLVIVLAVVAAVSAIAKRLTGPRDDAPASFDEWPDVPHNPASS
ncbi:MAG: hypothetical protein ACRDV0_03945 [Acidimicrobiales bacterium]